MNKYFRNRDGKTFSTVPLKENLFQIDLIDVIPLLKKIDYPFIAELWYKIKKENTIPLINYCSKIRRSSFCGDNFNNSIKLNNKGIWIEQLKTELKNHKEILDLVYREEEVEL